MKKSKETRGRKPQNDRPFDGRAMIRCFSSENAAWEKGAKLLAKRLGREVTPALFLRLAANAMADALKKKYKYTPFPGRAVRKPRVAKPVVKCEAVEQEPPQQPTEIIVENSTATNDSTFSNSASNVS